VDRSGFRVYGIIPFAVVHPPLIRLGDYFSPKLREGTVQEILWPAPEPPRFKTGAGSFVSGGDRAGGLASNYLGALRET